MDSRTKTHKENVFSFLSVAELNMKCLRVVKIRNSLYNVKYVYLCRNPNWSASVQECLQKSAAWSLYEDTTSFGRSKYRKKKPSHLRHKALVCVSNK